MRSLASWPVFFTLAFALAFFLLAATPGPGLLMVVARALADGFRAGLAAIAGLVLGDLVFLLLAILGMSALAAVMGEFFLAVKVVGAAMLFLVVGFYAWLAARAGRVVRSERTLAWLNRLTGGLLVGAGIAVATR